jgi:hypothetical protein
MYDFFLTEMDDVNLLRLERQMNSAVALFGHRSRVRVSLAIGRRGRRFCVSQIQRSITRAEIYPLRLAIYPQAREGDPPI